MANAPNSTLTLSDIIKELQELGVGSGAINNLVAFLARDRWQAEEKSSRREYFSADLSRTALAVAAQIDEHCDRTHGVNAAMIGLREILGEETSIAGVHQLLTDLADHAKSLKRSFDALLLDLETGGQQHG